MRKKRPYVSKPELSRAGYGSEDHSDAAFYKHRETKAADPDPYRPLRWSGRTTKYEVADLIHNGRRGVRGQD